MFHSAIGSSATKGRAVRGCLAEPGGVCSGWRELQPTPPQSEGPAHTQPDRGTEAPIHRTPTEDPKLSGSYFAIRPLRTLLDSKVQYLLPHAHLGAMEVALGSPALQLYARSVTGLCETAKVVIPRAEYHTVGKSAAQPRRPVRPKHDR